MVAAVFDCPANVSPSYLPVLESQRLTATARVTRARKLMPQALLSRGRHRCAYSLVRSGVVLRDHGAQPSYLCSSQAHKIDDGAVAVCLGTTSF